MRCPNCGKVIPSDVKHCAYCGAQISSVGKGRAEDRRAGGCRCLFGAIIGLVLLSLLFVAVQRLFFSDSDHASDLLLELTAPSSGISAIVFSNTGETLAAGARGGEIFLWDIPDGTLARTLGGDPGSIQGLAFSRDDATLVSGSAVPWDRPGQIRLWDVGNGICIQIFDLGSEETTKIDVEALDLSRDGRQLAVGTVLGSHHGSVELWSAAGWTRTTRWETVPLADVAFSPDASSLAVAMRDGTVELRRIADGQVVRTFAHAGRAAAAAFSPDGSQLATGGSDIVKVWQIQSGTLLREMRGFPCSATSVAFSPDASVIAAGSACLDGGQVTLWRSDDTAILREFSTDDGVEAIAFSPDGGLVAAGADNMVYVWRMP